MMVRLSKTRDKFVEQRQGRTDGAIRSTTDRRPMGNDPSLSPETAPASKRWKASVGRSQSAGRHFVDSAQRRWLAGFARGISFPDNLLAAASGLGRATGLAHHWAFLLSGAERAPATELERVVSGRQFRSGQK